ncbi:MAG: hypothetical protein HW386_505 [Gammaproteobacteria bacterium]|nr:hypothetical protein [Gammaproteobacteria bacterium]
MKNLLIVVAVIGILTLAFYWINKNRQSEQPPETVQITMPAENTPESPVQNIPIPAQQPVATGAEKIAAIPLPELDQSDGVIREELAGLYDAAQLDILFLLTDAVRHFVVTVDNMTAVKLPQKFKFTRLPADKFLVQKNADESEYIAQANYDRYAVYVTFIESLNLTKVVDMYFKYYPLFQQAYAELGYPDRNFNDRLIEVVDHLLATPVVPEPVKLLQPKVYYTYADENLETLSAGQKLMVRIGQSNANKIKSRLQNLRVELAAGR